MTATPDLISDASSGSVDSDEASATSVSATSVSATSASAPAAGSENRTWEPVAWDLSDLLPDASDETLRARLVEHERALDAFLARREELNDEIDAAVFLELLGEYEALYENFDFLRAHANLSFSADTQDPVVLTRRARLRRLQSEMSNRLLFFSLWWKGVDDETAQRLTPDGEEHRDARYFLEEMRRFRPYTLDESSESLINVKNPNGVESIITIYSMLASRYKFEIEVDGEGQTLGDSEGRSLYSSPDPQARENAYQAMLGHYREERPVLGHIYASRVRDWGQEYVDLRNFASPISVRNLANDIPDDAVQNLLDVARDNASIFREYFKLKAGWLGREKLRRYDLYAPLATETPKIPYHDAVEMVLSTLHGFDDRVGRAALRVFDENHMDSVSRPGKRGGAFCATVGPKRTPYVMMTYTGRARDVATLAHELGHAVHSVLAENHSYFTQHASLPLSETASVFAEMLLTDRLLKEEQDPLVRRELLASAIDDIYATVMRQAFFVRWEIDAHHAIRENKTVDQLSEIYLENLREQFGDSLELSDDFADEWLMIPHFFNTPFYCYAYSFGQLLVLALYRRYQQEGDAFVPTYLRMLSRGGSLSPTEILAEAGMDFSAGLWQDGFQVVRDLIAELVAIEESLQG